MTYPNLNKFHNVLIFWLELTNKQQSFIGSNSRHMKLYNTKRKTTCLKLELSFRNMFKRISKGHYIALPYF